MADGQIRPVDKAKVQPETFRRAIQPADGNVLGPDW
jgi:hypothetical protein